jgi:hypothetical protein
VHLRSGLGQPAAEVAPDAAGPVNSDTHSSLLSGPQPLPGTRVFARKAGITQSPAATWRVTARR